MSLNHSGFQSIESVREEFRSVYPVTNFARKLQLKMWLNHSESRHQNNNEPFIFHNYLSRLNKNDFIEQIQLDVINVDDIGGKEKVLAKLILKLDESNIPFS